MSQENQMQILGNPIEVTVGDATDPIILKAHPVQVKDYEYFAKRLHVAGLEIFEFHEMLEYYTEGDFIPLVIREYHQLLIDTGTTVFGAIQLIKDGVTTPIIDRIMVDIHELFTLVFDDETALDSVKTEEQFEMCKNMIRQINGIDYKKPSPNPEIRYWDEMKAKLEAKKGNSVTFEAMYTSIIVETGMLPKDINEMTIFQFMKTFERIQHFKAHEMSVLGAVVGGGEIHQWFATTKEEQPRSISHDEIYNSKEKEI